MTVEAPVHDRDADLERRLRATLHVVLPLLGCDRVLGDLDDLDPAYMPDLSVRPSSPSRRRSVLLMVACSTAVVLVGATLTLFATHDRGGPSHGGSDTSASTMSTPPETRLSPLSSSSVAATPSSTVMTGTRAPRSMAIKRLPLPSTRKRLNVSMPPRPSTPRVPVPT